MGQGRGEEEEEEEEAIGGTAFGEERPGLIDGLI